MSKTVENIVNIIGVALLLGLVLRYHSEAANLVNVTGGQITSLYQAVSLQTVAGTAPRPSNP